MTIRTITSRVLQVMLAASLVVAWGSADASAEEKATLKQQADYNRSMAALMAGVSQLKAAQANVLTQKASHQETLVKIQETQEKIRTAKLANELKAAQDYYERKKMHSQYLDAKRSKRLAREKLQELAGKGAPARLTAYTSAASSRIKWPHLLTTEGFADKRAVVERLMAERTVDNSGAGTRNCEGIERAVEDMRSALKGQLKDIDPMEYVAVKKFLDSVACEARFVVQPKLDAVASK